MGLGGGCLFEAGTPPTQAALLDEPPAGVDGGARFVAASGMSPSSHRAPVTRACKAHCKAPVLLVALVELTEFVLNLPIPGFLVCFSGFEKPREGTYREM